MTINRHPATSSVWRSEAGVTRRWLVGLLAGALIALADAPAGLAHSLEAVEKMLSDREFYLEVVNQRAADFTLLDPSGRAVNLKEFRGKVVVLYFIYTNCPDECPLQSEKLAGIQKAINATPMRDMVRFIAVTTDPARDTPAVLRAYGPLHGLDPANWVFLTSGIDRPAATRNLAGQYGLKFTPGEGSVQTHGIVTHVIDKSGNLRARYHGLKFNDTNLIIHINALTNDNH